MSETWEINPKLRPCPFCGSVLAHALSTMYKSWYIECINCDARGGKHAAKQTAVDMWNQRANIGGGIPIKGEVT